MDRIWKIKTMQDRYDVIYINRKTEYIVLFPDTIKFYNSIKHGEINK